MMILENYHYPIHATVGPQTQIHVGLADLTKVKPSTESKAAVALPYYAGNSSLVHGATSAMAHGGGAREAIAAYKTILNGFPEDQRAVGLPAVSAGRSANFTSIIHVIADDDHRNSDDPAQFNDYARATTEVLKAAHQEGIALVVMPPFNGGFTPTQQTVEAMIGSIQRFMQEHENTSIRDIALSIYGLPGPMSEYGGIIAAVEYLKNSGPVFDEQNTEITSVRAWRNNLTSNLAALSGRPNGFLGRVTNRIGKIWEWFRYDAIGGFLSALLD